MTPKAPDPRVLLTTAAEAAASSARELVRLTETIDEARNALYASPFLAGGVEPPNLDHAASYAGTANVLRRRAERQEGETKAETLARAAWFEGRAKVKREGGTMPRALRVPGERLRFVDTLRHALLRAGEAIAEVDGADVGAFVGYLVDGDKKPLHDGAIEETTRLALAAIERITAEIAPLLERLGLAETEDGEQGFFEWEQPLTFEDDEPTTGR